MKYLKHIFFIGLLAIAFASCKDDDGAYRPEPSAFSVSAGTSSIPAAGGTVSLAISAGNLGWWIETSAGWCKVSKLYGSGDATVTLTIEANASGSPRTAAVKVNPTFGQKSVSIDIKQQ